MPRALLALLALLLTGLTPLAAPQAAGTGPHGAALAYPADAPAAGAARAGTPPAAWSWREVRYGNRGKLKLRSEAGLVLDEREGAILFARRVDRPQPVASLTKLLAVMVVLEAGLDPEERIRIGREDRALSQRSRSRLPLGVVLRREDLMQVAFVASDNRAMAALGRTFPGGTRALVDRMNDRARQIGMTRSRFTDPTGLDATDVSTARDLARLAQAARRHARLSEWSSTARFSVTDQRSGRPLEFRNTNGLAHRSQWDLDLSKTGFTSEAGYCILFRTTIADRPVTVVLLRSWGSHTKYGDAGRIRDWIVETERRMAPVGEAVADTGPRRR